MDSLQRQAQAVTAQYLDALPEDHTGRYSLLADTSTLAALFRAIQSGANDKTACNAAGIDPRTLQRWAEHAEKHPDSAHAAFVVLLSRARDQRKVKLLERLERAGETDWRADAWNLERTDQDQFALKRDTEAGKVGVTIICGGDASVQVVQQPTFASSVSVVSADMHSLSDATGSDK